MSGSLGSFRHQIADKGRINLPLPFRREADGGPMVHAVPDALAPHPQRSWAEVETRQRELFRHEPEACPHVLGTTAGAEELFPDRQRRILLPQWLPDAVGICGAAMLVGASDRVEMCDPDRFAASIAAPAGERGRFGHSVFG